MEEVSRGTPLRAKVSAATSLLLTEDSHVATPNQREPGKCSLAVLRKKEQRSGHSEPQSQFPFKCHTPDVFTYFQYKSSLQHR